MNAGVGATDFARSFAAALKGSQPPMGIGKRGGRSDAGRFRIYRNNAAVALATALERRFPVVRQLVGEACFAALARAYTSVRQPVSPAMLSYGDDLVAFIDAGAFPAVSDLPYLADVARLEAAITQAYHAADAPVADLGMLASLASETIDATRLRPHPAARLLSSLHPIGTIWSAHQSASVSPIARWIAETVLVTRPDTEIRLTILPPEDVPFIAAVLNGQAIGAVAQTLEPMPDVGRALVALVQLGAVETLLEPEIPS